MINTSTITNWISLTNNELASISDTSKKEYSRFVQIYFLYNNIFKSVNDTLNPKIIASPSDKELMTAFLPELIKVKWGNVNADQQIPKEVNSLCISMQNYVEEALERGFSADRGKRANQNLIFTEFKMIGHFNDTTSSKIGTLTKSDFENFSKIVNYDKFAKNKTIALFEGVLKTIYAIRNNFYHGEKSDVSGQQPTLFYINLSMVKLVRIAYLIISKVNNSSLNQTFLNELDNIESPYKLKLGDRLKENLKKVYEENKSDLDKWINIANTHSTYMKFSYLFVVLERICSIVRKAIFEYNLDIISLLKQLEFDLSESFTYINQVETTYNQCKQVRNDIFHGNSSIVLNQTQIRSRNNDLENAIRLTKIWIESLILANV